jgi:arginine decarboxylase
MTDINRYQQTMAKHLIPRKLFFTGGVGRHPDHLTSFAMALRDAGVEYLNLVTVSSIVPPECQVISKESGIVELDPGEIAFVVLSRNESNNIGELVSASIGCALPGAPGRFGYLAEYHTTGTGRDETLGYACNLAAGMYDTLSGDDDPEIMGIAKDAVADQGWTTVVCAAVFLM